MWKYANVGVNPRYFVLSVGGVSMRVFEVFIEVDDMWVSLGNYEADSGEHAMLFARGDTEQLKRYYPPLYWEFVNLDFVDLTPENDAIG